MKEYPFNRDDKGFVRNERITLEALAIFSKLTKVAKEEREKLVKKYNELVSGLKARG